MPRSTRLLRDRMLRDGLCPHRVTGYLAKFSYSTLYYMTSLPSYKTSGTSLTGCLAETRCVAGNIGDTVFQARHVAENCSCTFVGPDMNEVSSILEDGDIPLISCVLGPGNDPDLQVIKASYGTDYTAINHVWAEGLCQLQRLLGYLYQVRLTHKKRNLHPLSGATHSFGLETLLSAKKQPLTLGMGIFCVPVPKNERFSSLKTKAISLMTPTYAKALRVLVLDSEL